MSNKGWTGVDLDGTLAIYDHWRGEDHIGDPVPLMLHRVKTMLAAGEDVRIFTARVDGGEAAIAMGRNGEAFRDVAKITSVIEAWCLKHIGQVLPVTNKKDFGMVRLFDDRAIQIEYNTGMRMDGEKDYECGCCDSLDEDTIEGPCTCPEWCPNG